MIRDFIDWDYAPMIQALQAFFESTGFVGAISIGSGSDTIAAIAALPRPSGAFLDKRQRTVFDRFQAFLAAR